MNDAHGKVDFHSVRCRICDQDHVPEMTCLQAWLVKLKTESQGCITNIGAIKKHPTLRPMVDQKPCGTCATKETKATKSRAYVAMSLGGKRAT